MASTSIEYILKLKDQFSKTIGKAKTGVDGVSKSVGGLGSIAKKVGGIMATAFAGLAIFNTIKSVATLGVEMEQTRVAFSTFLGDADKANKVIAELNEFANVTPFDNKQVIQSGRVLLAFGTASDKLIPTLKTIGDVSAATGKDFNELTTIYGKAKIAGKLMAEDINQLVEAGVPIIGEFAKQFGVTEDQVKKLGSESKISFSNLEQAFQDMTGPGGKFFDLMAKQSKTVGGLFSTLLGTLQTIGIAIGEAMLPALGKMVSGIQSFVGFMRDRFTALKVVFAPITTALQPIIDAFGRLFDSFAKGSGDATMLERVFNAIGNVLEFLAPTLLFIGETVGFLVDKIGELVFAISDWITKTETVQKVLRGVFRGSLSLARNFVQGMKRMLSGIADLIIGVITMDIDKIGEGLAGIGEALLRNNPLVAGIDAAKEFARGFSEEAQQTDFFKKTRFPTITPLLKTGQQFGPLAPTGVDGQPIPGAKPIAPKGDLKAGISDIKSSAPKNFTINIDKLIENLQFNTTNLSESTTKIRDEVVKVLFQAVNDVNTIAT